MKNMTLTLAALLIATPNAFAQTFEGNVSSYETPFGMNNVTDIDSPAGVRRNENFNRTQIQSPGWGFTSTAIGNLINVQTEGNNNTVVINATQVNNGTQNASSDRGL
jgi:hypothetical protein